MNNVLRANGKDSDLKIKILDHSIDQYVGSTGIGARTTQVRIDYKLVYEIEKMIILTSKHMRTCSL